jgi:hypothetical protein
LLVDSVRYEMLSLFLTFLLMAAAPAPGEQTAAPTRAGDVAAAKDLNLRAYVELLRSDLRTQKIAILTELMEFTETEDKAFWPVYREYDAELGKINDERVNLIEEYARSYTDLSDAVADRLATGALELEARRAQLKSKYYQRFKSVLSPKTAARFLQVENQLLLLVDLQIASSLPVVK